MTTKEWFSLVNNASTEDIELLLAEAPPAVQKLRGAFERPEFGLMVRLASAVSFMEGFELGRHSPAPANSKNSL